MLESQRYKGKASEKLVVQKLKEITKSKDWWYYSFPDAALCRGRLPKQPSDYLIMYRGVPALLEIKEIKKAILPCSRFTQLPKMRLFEMAQGHAGFAIFRDDIAKWYLLDVFDAMPGDGVKSINLDTFVGYPTLKMLFERIQSWLTV